MKYTVVGKIHVQSQIEAPSLEEALCEMKRRYPKARLEYIDLEDEEAYDVAGTCEACGKVLLHDYHKFYSDSEGCLICEECCGEELKNSYDPDEDYGRAG